MAKVLMNIERGTMAALAAKHNETGMGLQIVETRSGLVAVLADGSALPCYSDHTFYDTDDVLAGEPLPAHRDDRALTILSVFKSRAAASVALQAGGVSASFSGTAGAVPLIASYKLARATVFFRCLRTATDPRFSSTLGPLPLNGTLAAGTYLTTALDILYANSGFATVGRFALPIPLPASFMNQYELPRGAVVKVGTVAPMFGQSGGGVEVRIDSPQSAIQVGHNPVPEY